MVAEKQAGAAARFGASASELMGLPFIEYLTRHRLAEASCAIGLHWNRQRVVYPLWYEAPPLVSRAPSPSLAVPVRSVVGAAAMILLLNPRATRPANRRFPLSMMAIGAALPEGTTWEFLDGNLPDIDMLGSVTAHVERQQASNDPIRAIALTVMPDPQLVSAVPLSKAIKARHPDLPIIWGGNFCSLYPEPVLHAPYVDWVVRGQGEQTFNELLEAIDGRRNPRKIGGIAFRETDGSIRKTPERIWRGPDELPTPPYHKIDVGQYLQPTFLGHRSGVHQASIGCPYGCNFCGVISVFGRKEKVQSPARTAEHLRSWRATRHGFGPFLRQQFLPEQGARHRDRRRLPPARPQMVVRGARRRARAFLR